MNRWKCIYLFTRPFSGCKFWQRPCNTILCTDEIFTDRTTPASLGYITYILRRVVRGFRLCDIASLVMYCNDASLRIVTKSLYRAAPPFSILNGHSWLYLPVRDLWIPLCKGRSDCKNSDKLGGKIRTTRGETLYPREDQIRMQELLYIIQ